MSSVTDGQALWLKPCAQSSELGRLRALKCKDLYDCTSVLLSKVSDSGRQYRRPFALEET